MPVGFFVLPYIKIPLFSPSPSLLGRVFSRFLLVHKNFTLFERVRNFDKIHVFSDKLLTFRAKGSIMGKDPYIYLYNIRAHAIMLEKYQRARSREVTG